MSHDSLGGKNDFMTTKTRGKKTNYLMIVLVKLKHKLTDFVITLKKKHSKDLGYEKFLACTNMICLSVT